MISIALSALGVVYPNRFAPYGKFLVGCLYFGIGLCVLTALLWMFGRVRSTSENRQEKGPVASHVAKAEVGHIEQKDIGAKASAELHLHFPSTQPDLGPQPAAALPAKNLVPRPQIEIRLSDPLLVVEETVVRFAKGGEKESERCLALYAINKPAAQGQQPRPARSVFACLEFKTGSRTTDVNRACWIGRDSNEITIGVSETEHILVGLPSEDEWITYHNPNMVREVASDFFVYKQPLAELERRSLNWGQGASYTVDVRIICNHPGPLLGETLAHKQFILERTGTSFTAKMLG